MSGNYSKVRPVFLHKGRTVVSAPGTHEMGEEIVRILADEHQNAMSHVKVNWHDFANKEGKPEIPETVRGEHVFLLCQLQFPHPDVAFMRMMIIADALMRASVNGMTLVLPYFPYTRQDRKANPREPITARVLANIIETNSSVQRMITFDLHAAQIQGFFNIPVDDLHGLVLHADYLRKHFNGNFNKVTIVAPDVGSVKRAKKLAQLLGPKVPFAVIDKDRKKDGEAESLAVLGHIRNRDCVVCDDMIDGGGTIRNACKSLKKKGAHSAIAVVTHGIFSGNATEQFRLSKVKVVATQTIPRAPKFRAANASWLSFAPIEPRLAQTIHEASLVGGSISKLFVK